MSSPVPSPYVRLNSSISPSLCVSLFSPLSLSPSLPLVHVSLSLSPSLRRARSSGRGRLRTGHRTQCGSPAGTARRCRRTARNPRPPERAPDHRAKLLCVSEKNNHQPRCQLWPVRLLLHATSQSAWVSEWCGDDGGGGGCGGGGGGGGAGGGAWCRRGRCCRLSGTARRTLRCVL